MRAATPHRRSARTRSRGCVLLHLMRERLQTSQKAFSYKHCMSLGGSRACLESAPDRGQLSTQAVVKEPPDTRDGNLRSTALYSTVRAVRGPGVPCHGKLRAKSRLAAEGTFLQVNFDNLRGYAFSSHNTHPGPGLAPRRRSPGAAEERVCQRLDDLTLLVSLSVAGPSSLEVSPWPSACTNASTAFPPALPLLAKFLPPAFARLAGRGRLIVRRPRERT